MSQDQNDMLINPSLDDEKPDGRLEERKKNFMKGMDCEDLKRKKEEGAFELRKSVREEAFMKRRNLQQYVPQDNSLEQNQQNQEIVMDQESEQSAFVQTFINVNERFKSCYNLQDLTYLVEKIYSTEDIDQLDAAQGFRKLLSIELDPPIQQVIDANVVNKLIEFLSRTDFQQLQFESAWALTNIASGTPLHTQVIVEKGAVPLIIKLLESPNVEVVEQAVWAIGNISGDAAHCRDLILQHGGLQPLINILNTTKRPSMTKNGSWALSNLCRGKPPPSFDQVSAAIPTLAKIVNTQSDTEILTDTCWALCYLSDGNQQRIQKVLDSGVLKRMITLLSHHVVSIQIPALRTIGNVVTGSDQQTQEVINQGVLPSLLCLLSSPKKAIRKEATWTISNITAGSKDQVNQIMKYDFMPKLIQMCEHDEFEVSHLIQIKKEAVWAISNAASGGDLAHLARVVELGAIKALSSLLTAKDPKVVGITLEGLNQILKVGQESFLDQSGNNPFADILEECGGLAKIENLQEHPNNQIYEKAVKIIEKYYGIEDQNDIFAQLTIPQAGFSF